MFIILFHQFLILAVFDYCLGAVGVVGAHYGSHAVADRLFPVGVGVFHEAFQVFQELVVVEGDGLADVDELIIRLREAFLGHKLFFIELLAGAEAGVFDLDVHIGLEAGEADHIAGQGVDLHRGSHIEDEDLTPVGIGAGQHHKAHGLGDGHEVADDIRVGDRDGAALFNLLLEDGNHGAVGAQDVSESHGDELGLHTAEDFARAVPVGVLFPDVGEELWEIGGAAGFNLGVEGLDDHLTDALTCAHDVRGVHGLVGGDQDKALAAVDHGGVGGLIGADGVVLDGFAGAVLHEGDVLVGGGVIDDLWMVLLKDLEHAAAVADGADEGHEVEIRILLAQLQLDGVGVVFVDIEDDELLRMVPGHLAAELRADAPAPAGDEDDLAVDEVINLVKVGGDGFAAQKVLDGNVPEFRDRDLTVDELVIPGEHLHLTAGLVADTEDFLPVFPRHAGYGEKDLRHLILLDILKDRLSSADDGDALDGAVPLVGVVVDDADGNIVYLVRGLHVTEDHPSGLSRADDHDAATGLALTAQPGPQEEQEAEEEAQAHDEEQLKHASPDIVRHRHAAVKSRDEDNVENGGGEGAEDGLGEFLDARVAPHDAVHVEAVENDHREDGVDGDEGGIGLEVAGRDGRIVAVEAEPEGQEVGDVNHREVVDHGKEGDDLPMLKLLQILQVAHLLLKVECGKCKVELQ